MRHLLLQPPEEGVHELAEEGAERVEEDPELAPGHDCCAVCAGPLHPDTVCKACESVHYCSPQHLVNDAPGHARVCALLRCMRDSAQLLAGQQQADRRGSDEGDEGDEGGGGGAAAAQATSNNAPSDVSTLPPSASAPGRSPQAAACESFRRPDRDHHGWAHVAPERFRAVYGGEGGDICTATLEAGASDSKPDAEPARKRPRRLDADAAGAADGSAHPPDPTRQQPLSPGREGTPGRTAPPDGAAAEALGLAAELADRTAVLTYPYTAAFALLNCAPAREAARRAAAANRPLEAVVLGAAEDAELAELPSWQVLGDALGQDVRILFVGPQVPDDLDGTEAQHGRCAMRFLQSTYDGASGHSGAGAARGRGGGRTPCSSTPQAPDVYFAFNPGFTCPDYDWSHTLETLTRTTHPGTSSGGSSSSGPDRGATAAWRPCLVVATNTRMEALMEEEELRGHGLRSAAPVSRNPYTSLRTDQSGTLANDLYRKNAWLTVYEQGIWKAKASMAGKRRRNGGKVAKAVAKRMARAVYDNMVAPVARLLRRR